METPLWGWGWSCRSIIEDLYQGYTFYRKPNTFWHFLTFLLAGAGPRPGRGRGQKNVKKCASFFVKRSKKEKVAKKYKKNVKNPVKKIKLVKNPAKKIKKIKWKKIKFGIAGGVF